MWRLSDSLFAQFEGMLEESYKAVKKIAEQLKCRWQILPDPEPCSACGVDGSRGVERLSGVVFYAISGVSVGKRILEMHEVTMLKPYKHIDERIRLHMHTSEFRLGAMSEGDVILMDGTLTGAIIRPPAYVGEFEKKLEELRRAYYLNEMIDDFIFVLDNWFSMLEERVKSGKGRLNTLFTRTERFDKMEIGYRKGTGKYKEDVTVLFEYIEYLHALNRLLEKNVVFVAKSFYTSEFSKNAAITDTAVLEYLARKQFGDEKAAYIKFSQKVDKSVPFIEYFDNIRKIEVNSAFVRFADYANIYLIETPLEINLDLLAKLRGLEIEGYLLPLIHAHRYAEIKRKELKSMMQTLINATDPKYSFLLKKGRGVLEY